MRLKAKLFFLASICFFALASFILTVFNHNPFSAGYSVFVIFYLSLFVTLTGIISFIIMFIKSHITSSVILKEYFWPSARQGAVLALILTVLLLLRGLRTLDFWVGVPLAVAILLLELFFRGNKFKKTR